MSQFWPSCISGTSHTPCQEVPSALLPVCSAIALLHIWHKSHTLLGSSICTHLARKFYLHCCLFALLLPDPLPIRTSSAPPASSLLFFFSSFLVFHLVHQSKSQVSSQVRSRLLDQLDLSSALLLPCHSHQRSDRCYCILEESVTRFRVVTKRTCCGILTLTVCCAMKARSIY